MLFERIDILHPRRTAASFDLWSTFTSCSWLWSSFAVWRLSWCLLSLTRGPGGQMIFATITPNSSSVQQQFTWFCRCVYFHAQFFAVSWRASSKGCHPVMDSPFSDNCSTLKCRKDLPPISDNRKVIERIAWQVLISKIIWSNLQLTYGLQACVWFYVLP